MVIVKKINIVIYIKIWVIDVLVGCFFGIECFMLVFVNKGIMFCIFWILMVMVVVFVLLLIFLLVFSIRMMCFCLIL